MPKTCSIVLIGFMGTGKSAIGRALAQRTDALLVDTDTEIERQAGHSVAKIFAQDGEAAFRALETDTLRLLLAQKGEMIVATGGGTPLRRENAALLQSLGAVVWLTASPSVILSRVGRVLASRPLLANYLDDPLSRIETLVAERSPAYQALAEWEFDTGACGGPEEAADQILSLLFQKNM